MRVTLEGCPLATNPLHIQTSNLRDVEDEPFLVPDADKFA